MNKTEFIAAVAEKAELPKKNVQTVLDTVLDEIRCQVAAGQEVAFIGFGTFKTATRKARPGRNPSTGEMMQIPASTVPKFVAGKGFKDAVKAPKKKCRAKKSKK